MKPAFSPPDYQRTRSFGGQNRLTVSSRTNVSAPFSLLSVCRSASTIRNTMFNGEKITWSLSATSFESIFQHPSLFFSPSFVEVEFLVSHILFSDQSSARTDPHKGHVQFAHQLWQQWHQTRRSSDGKHQEKRRLSGSNIWTLRFTRKHPCA